ncbi:MAG: DUF4352 domain-containing protein [Chloroflexota bacterium]|nr:DUF4352 domain-containing protein [Chloroflexota bacterium]
MRRTMLGLGAAGALLILILVATVSGARPGTRASSAQDAATPTSLANVRVVQAGAGTPSPQDPGADATATRAAEEAELADLRTRVAGLSTEVARLGGTGAVEDEAALAGRLGGQRGGFDAAYGPAVASSGDDEVAYDVPDVGRATVTFDDGRAVQVVVSPDRPADKPVSEEDPADWSLARAQEIAASFAPEDADLPEPERARPAEGRESSGESRALADAATPTADACPVEETGAFTVDYTTPTRNTVSVVTLTLRGGAAAEPDPPLTRLPGPGGSVTRVRSSLPSGLTNVNGVTLRGIQARLDAEGEEPAGENGRYVAVELEIENGTIRELVYEPEHFVLTDAEGRELLAACGGVERAILAGELAPGESVAGWVSFLVPEDFDPEAFTYLVNGSNGTLIVFTVR